LSFLKRKALNIIGEKGSIELGSSHEERFALLYMRVEKE